MDTGLKFLPLGVKLESDELSHLETIQESLSRLTNRRQTILHCTFYEPISSTAIMYCGAVLYRVVAAAQGVIINWNAGNMLCSFLAARALLETFALFWDCHRVIKKGVESGDLNAIAGKTIRLAFGTRDGKLLEELSELSALSESATNILTFVNKLDRGSEEPTFRWLYDKMSERCHPNLHGTLLMYGEVDKMEKVTYSDRYNAASNFRLLVTTFGLVEGVELMLDQLDEWIEDVDGLERMM